MRVKAKIVIVGKRPILFNNFSIESISLEKKERTGVAGNDPEEWRRSVLKTAENQLYVNAQYIFGCLREGGKYIKEGRGSIQVKIASTLLVLDEIILLNRFLPSDKDLKMDKTLPVYLDVRPVKNPNTKGRNIRYRIAASSGWRVSFQIEWDATVVARKQMESALIHAGDFVGLGDGRSIGFGRFSVEVFEYVDEVKK